MTARLEINPGEWHLLDRQGKWPASGDKIRKCKFKQNNNSRQNERVLSFRLELFHNDNLKQNVQYNSCFTMKEE